MNTQEYIESGILEAYVLDTLPTAERLQVAQDIAKYPELAAEVAAIEETMFRFATSQARTPKPDLKEKVWNALQHESGRKSRVVDFTSPQVSNGRSSIRLAASWILLAGSVAANIWMFTRVSSTNKEAELLKERLNLVQNRQDSLSNGLSAYSEQMNLLADTTMNTVVMRSMKPEAAMFGILFIKKGTGDMYLSLHGMPTPPPGKQYQLWVIKDGKPVDMGILPKDMTTAKLRKMQGTTGGQAFAISLEKEGGSPVPTMDQIFVLGKV